MHDEMLATFDVRLATPASIQRAEAGAADWCAAELLRAKAEWLVQSGPDHMLLAETLLLNSVALAARQGALAWELRATISLARLRAMQERRRSAREILQSVLKRCVEGLTTQDVRAAKDLLAGLAAVSPKLA
jgi:predicted ATPase